MMTRALASIMVVVVGIALTASLPDVQELDVPTNTEELLQMSAGTGGIEVDTDGAGETPPKKLGATHSLCSPQ